MKIRLIVLSLTVGVLIYSLCLFRPSVEPGLTERIRKVRREVNNVNSGGCGFHAKYVKEYLDRQGIDSKLVWIKKPMHFMVAVDGTYIDRNGYFSRAYPPLWFEHDTISPDSLQHMLNDSVIWNDAFKRVDSAKLHKILLE